jgi:hypothetical protein
LNPKQFQQHQNKTDKRHSRALWYRSKLFYGSVAPSGIARLSSTAQSRPLVVLCGTRGSSRALWHSTPLLYGAVAPSGTARLSSTAQSRPLAPHASPLQCSRALWHSTGLLYGAVCRQPWPDVASCKGHQWLLLRQAQDSVISGIKSISQFRGLSRTLWHRTPFLYGAVAPSGTARLSSTVQSRPLAQHGSPLRRSRALWHSTPLLYGAVAPSGTPCLSSTAQSRCLVRFWDESN